MPRPSQPTPAVRGSWAAASLILLVGLALRCAVGLWPHSGQGVSPLHGDFEAQRHWKEVTIHLPVHVWYFNSSRNDLNYWGLDYPPLTAYHSWVAGQVAHWLAPEYVALNASRGLESPGVKFFMRMSALAGDLLVFFPAAIAAAWCQRPAGQSLSIPTLASLILQPGLILIDHGHFQYNAISLGLALAAVAAVASHRHLLGSALFVLSLNYKQMSLYYAPVFFFGLLGLAFQRYRWSWRTLGQIASIGVVVLATFALCWLPFIAGGAEQVLQVLHRIFPVARGLFEDKVANIWCVLDVPLKLRRLPVDVLLKVSLASTVAAFAPSMWMLLQWPTPLRWNYAMACCSLAFFLFSFQVHEKTILLPAVPLALLAMDEPLVSVWFAIIANFSMYPLLRRDGLAIPSIALTIFYGLTMTAVQRLPSGNIMPKLLFGLSIAGCAVLLLLAHTVPAPDRYPHIHELACVAYSALHFAVWAVWLNWRMFNSTAMAGKVKAA